MALTDKQERFCQLASIGTYADAYREAYGAAPGYNHSDAAWKLRKNPEIQRRIIELQAAAHKPVKDALSFLLAWHFARMMYDPAEISAWAVGACRHCHGDGGAYQWRLQEYLDAVRDAERGDVPLPDCSGGFGYNSTIAPNRACSECDGKGKGRSAFADTSDLSPMARAAFEGIKQTKDGLEIKMADKAKAAEQFAKLGGLDVIQVRNVVEPIPDAAALAKLRGDPDAMARVYASIVNGGSGRETTH